MPMITKIDSKKGIAYHMILWIPKIVYFILVFSTIFGFILLFSKTETYMGDVEAKVLMNRMYYYPDVPGVFSTYDKDLNRLYPSMGVTDGVDSEYLEKILFHEKNNLPIKMTIQEAPQTITVRDFGTEIEFQESGDQKHIFRDENVYVQWAPVSVFLEGSQDKSRKGRVFSYWDYRRHSDKKILKTNLIIKNE